MTDDDFSDLVEECNSPASKRIEQLERELAEARHHIEKYAAEARAAIDAHEDAFGKLAEARAQRDALAEALRACMRWSDCVDIPNEVQKMCHQALAAVKGGMP
jgi:predicted  nucleic acid-binding Zn-ribbon protein